MHLAEPQAKACSLYSIRLLPVSFVDRLLAFSVRIEFARVTSHKLPTPDALSLIVAPHSLPPACRDGP